MFGRRQQVPIQTACFAPFAPLPELAPHKEQFFAGMTRHIGIERPQVGEFAPEITRHLVEHGMLEVNDLIMAKGQDKIFAKGIDQVLCSYVVKVKSQLETRGFKFLL